jgi:hypothetical protein
VEILLFKGQGSGVVQEGVPPVQTQWGKSHNEIFLQELIFP